MGRIYAVAANPPSTAAAEQHQQQQKKPRAYIYNLPHTLPTSSSPMLPCFDHQRPVVRPAETAIFLNLATDDFDEYGGVGVGLQEEDIIQFCSRL